MKGSLLAALAFLASTLLTQRRPAGPWGRRGAADSAWSSLRIESSSSAVHWSDFVKAGLQAVAVAIGVGLGWWLNGRSQAKARVVQARADWAAAAETCLGTLYSLISSANKGVHPDSPALPQFVADRTTRDREHEDAKSSLRAGTVRLMLVDPTGGGADLRSVEEEIVGIEFYKQEARAQVQKARVRVREIVGRWIA